MKTKVTTLVIALVALFSFGTASAQNAHIAEIIGNPVVNSNGTTTVSFKIAGLGKNGSAFVQLFLSEEVSAECETNKGKIITKRKDSSSESLELKSPTGSGNVIFSLTTTTASSINFNICDGSSENGLDEVPGSRTSTGSIIYFLVNGVRNDVL